MVDHWKLEPDNSFTPPAGKPQALGAARVFASVFKDLVNLIDIFL